MKFLKIVVLVIVLLVGLFFAEKKFGFLPKKYSSMLNSSVGRVFGIKPEEIRQSVLSSSIEISDFQEKGVEISGQAQKIFSKAVEPSSEQKPIYDRALEYGRYLYCKEVVNSYEKQAEKEK